MRIRDFKIGDEEPLWTVFFSAIHETASRDYSQVQLDAWAPSTINMDAWIKRIRAINPFVAELDGEIAGYADLQPNGYIDHFFVAGRFARRGVGSLLMNRIHEAAKQMNIPILTSEVSLTARGFFERWGFTVEQPQIVQINGVELKNFRMRKIRET